MRFDSIPLQITVPVSDLRQNLTSNKSARASSPGCTGKSWSASNRAIPTSSANVNPWSRQLEAAGRKPLPSPECDICDQVHGTASWCSLSWAVQTARFELQLAIARSKGVVSEQRRTWMTSRWIRYDCLCRAAKLKLVGCLQMRGKASKQI